MIESDHLPEPNDEYPIRNALLSVYDKSNLVAFARRLLAHDVRIISTGGTAAVLREAELPVTDVSELTGFPEIMDGRVKTLHPAIHGGLLARRPVEEDLEELEQIDTVPIDLVVTNLYPFEEVTSDRDVSPATAAENIDIGGPSMIRAAAKNYFYVGVISSPRDYGPVADELDDRSGRLSLQTRRSLARKAFQRTAEYDRAIAQYFEPSTTGPAEASDTVRTTDRLEISLPRAEELRYGENPHQNAAQYGSPDRFYEKLHGKQLSYNNLQDLTAALALIDEFRDAAPTCAILKHTNPSGLATRSSLEAAYRAAFATDRQSPFGGIVVVNRPLDRPTAAAIDEIFTELIIAPAYEEGVLEILQQKKNRRLIRYSRPARDDQAHNVRSVMGGLLVQDRDPVLEPIDQIKERWDVPTDRQPSEEEWLDLDLAWRVVKHVKSNAIVYVKQQATVGVGAGQMSRIDASELAVMKSKKSDLDLSDSVVASDAFFPFADGLEAAAAAGARAAIQPGGSIRDQEVIDAANTHDMAMVFTGQRHFRH
jgi:phosphoribosylaminoimidazolecarboxamide formyltransferase/IMP cyclohydrolase